jgi:uncharacterized membrane protein YtjA (UPF0391 family)
MNLIVIGVIILVVAIVLSLLGFRGAAGLTAGVGKLILVVGVIIFLILIAAHLLGGS